MTPPRCGNLLQDDNLFVLTGDVRRIPYAVKKLDTLKYGQLYIIGAGATQIPDITHVQIESLSKSTYQNALAIKRIVAQKNIKRIVVITTEEHMKRATHLIHLETPDTELVTCSAPLTGMPASQRLQRWTVEYVKYLVTLFGIKEG